MGYQPVWRNGEALTDGERDSADRYEPIRKLLSGIEGPFTVLDFGANGGYFSARIAEDFPLSKITAVDDRDEVNQVKSEQIEIINRRLNAKQIRALPRYDVVLALSVLHHLKDWREALTWFRACRQFLVAEMPHPDEKWMRSSAARHELRPMHDAVAAAASAKLGSFERTGRDGSKHQRPMYVVDGSIERFNGEIFTGSGTCSRKLRPELHASGIDKALGYQPYPGSLNLRFDKEVGLGEPVVNWPGRINGAGRSRPYWFWPAWIGDYACHAMIPATRGHGPNHFEVVAPDSLRKRFGLVDGDEVHIDVMRKGI